MAKQDTGEPKRPRKGLFVVISRELVAVLRNLGLFACGVLFSGRL